MRVRVPASTSNLGPGFDCLGLALDVYLEAEAQLGGQELAIEVEGADADRISRDATNLVHACLRRSLRRAGLAATGLRLRIRSDIPLGRGLGSSAAATVAGLLLGHLLVRHEPPDLESLLAEAVEVEGHPDNAAPALFGGFMASAMVGERVHVCRLPFPEDVDVVLVVPDREVSTERARALLPSVVPLADAVHNLQRLALLLGSLSRGAGDLRPALGDRLHQARRLELLPGLGEALASLEADPECLGAALSGSGPTLLGFVRRTAPNPGAAAVRALARAGVGAVVRRARVEPRGAAWEQGRESRA
jgi:homoserine kinase